MLVKTVTVDPVVGVLMLVVFAIVFGNVFYRGLRKFHWHIKFGKHLFPNQVDKYFLLTSGWSTDFDLPTLVWFYSPVYYTKIPENKLDQQGLILHQKVKKASNQFLLATGIFAGYFGLFWLISHLYG